MKRWSYSKRLKMASSAEPSILKKLANDPHSDVREAVGGNPYAPKDTLRYFACYECCLLVLKAVLLNPSTPEDIKDKLNEEIQRYSEEKVN